MSDHSTKQLRKQLRNVVQEVLPSILNDEFKTAAYKQVSDEIKARLSAIEQHISETLKTIDDRSKEMQSFLMRETLKNLSAKTVTQDDKNTQV